MTKPTIAVQQTRQTDPNQSLAKLLNDAMPELKRIAPKYISLSRLTSLAIEATQRNHLLAKCSPMSVLNFCKKCSEWGTDRVGAGGVWPVPFWNSKANCYDMQAIPDWRLLVEKTKKAKAITDAYVDAVYEKDQFDYTRGTSPSLTHKPARGDRGRVTEVYCVYTLPDGSKNFVVMDWIYEVLPIRNRSQAWISHMKNGYSNPWVTDEVEMGKKVVIKRTLKLFEGASPELTALLDGDNVINGIVDSLSHVAPEPIQMPRAISDTQTTNAEAAQQDAPQDAGESQTDSGASDGQNAATGQAGGQGEAIRGVQQAEVTFEGYKRLESKQGTSRPWTCWVCTFITDSGAIIEAGTFDTKIADKLDVLKGKICEITYRPGKNQGTFEICTLSPCTSA